MIFVFCVYFILHLKKMSLGCNQVKGCVRTQHKLLEMARVLCLPRNLVSKILQRQFPTTKRECLAARMIWAVKGLTQASAGPTGVAHTQAQRAD
jgi:hypothetical protein